LTRADVFVQNLAPGAAARMRLGPEELAKYPPPLGSMPDLGGDTFFLRTNVSFTAVTRDRQWFRYAATPELMRADDT